MKERHPALLPVVTFLVAVSLCFISGATPRLLAHRRMMADPTGGCSVTKITILPLEAQATIPDAVTGYKYKDAIPPTPPGTAYTPDNCEAVPGAVVETLFDGNPNRGRGHRMFTGKATRDDPSHHDVLLAKIEGTATPNTIVRLVVESMDVDDPSDQDPPQPGFADSNAAINKAIKANRGQTGNDPTPQDLIAIALTGGHTGDSHTATPKGLPVVDWENFCFDNRGTPLGGKFLPWKDLKPVDQQSLLTNYQLQEASFNNIIFIDPNTRLAWTCRHVEPSVICSHIEVNVTVDGSGTWFQYVVCQVSQQPGDNYRLLACCKENEGILKQSIPLQSTPPGGAIGDVVIKRSERKDKPEGRAIGHCRHEDIVYDPLPPQVVKSELVTVWRRLYVEADMMGGTTWPADQLDPKSKTPPPVNMNHAFRPGIAPDLGLMAFYFNPVYVEPVTHLSVLSAVKPVLKFEPNLAARNPGPVLAELQPVRETPRANDYWSVHLVGAYESARADSEPVLPVNAPLDLGSIAGGRTGGSKVPLSLVTSMAYHETIRHVSDLGATGVQTVFGEPGRQTGPAAPGALPDIIQRCYVHEAVHQFSDSINHGDGGIMWPHVVWCGAGVDFVPTDPLWAAGSIPRRECALIRSVGSP